MQRDQRAEAAGASLFGAVREPVVGVTGGADSGDLDLFNPRAFEKDLIRLPQIKMDTAIVGMKQEFRFAPQLLLHLLNDIRADFIMIGSDGGSDARADIRRVGVVSFLHGADHLSRDAAQCPHPTCVRDADYAFARIVNHDRDAVREAHVEGHVWFVGEDDIRLAHRLAIGARRVGKGCVRAVNLPHVKDRVGIASQRGEGQIPIRAHARPFVAYRPADIE